MFLDLPLIVGLIGNKLNFKTNRAQLIIQYQFLTSVTLYHNKQNSLIILTSKLLTILTTEKEKRGKTSFNNDWWKSSNLRWTNANKPTTTTTRHN